MHLAETGRSVLPPKVRLGTLCPVLEPKTPSSYISPFQWAGDYEGLHDELRKSSTTRLRK